MADDGYAWWQARFRAFAAYVDVYRIDHVLGFFRIWEIPPGGYDGLVGHFRPTMPLRAGELRAVLGKPDLEALTQPFIDEAVVADRFGEYAAVVAERFFAKWGKRLRFAGELGSQRAIRAAFTAGVLGQLDEATRSRLERELLDLAADTLLLEIEGGYSPAIAWRDSEHYRQLPAAKQQAFDELALDFFHHRHDQMWEAQGRETLPAVVGATDLLACGEDLGMVPDIVPQIMNEMGLLSLEIERMPKRLGEWSADPATAPYLSVVSPGTHDTTTLRQWWREDPELIGRYWREALSGFGEPPEQLDGEGATRIVVRQLASPAMLCVLPIADLLATDDSLRRGDADAERINDPSNRHNPWKYRLHLTVQELQDATEFNAGLRDLITGSGRW
jgi:4-alpha-glucanotransferase